MTAYVCESVCACVRLLLKSSSWLLLGDSMPVKVDVAVGDFGCLMTQELRD